jgi:hypothetical protein
MKKLILALILLSTGPALAQAPSHMFRFGKHDGAGRVTLISHEMWAYGNRARCESHASRTCYYVDGCGHRVWIPPATASRYKSYIKASRLNIILMADKNQKTLCRIWDR